MNKDFNAWKVGLPYYLPPIVVGMSILPVLISAGYGYLGLPIPLAGLFALFFFRDPPRRISTEPGDIVSPADGTVVAIENLEDTPYYDGACTRVSIFLSVLSVHVNRAPESGTVRDVVYKEGAYMNAMNPESSNVNESNALRMETPHGPMTVRQISGAIARRIVCWPTGGESLKRGEKFGMIKFGSRTELYLSPDIEICVDLKSKVRAGASVIARAPQTETSS